MSIPEKQIQDCLERGFTRRHIGRMATLLTAGASLPFFNEFTMAQSAQAPMRGGMMMDPDMVKISGNENPMGPHPAGVEALYKVAPMGWRYNPGPEAGNLGPTIASIEGVPVDHVMVTAGSSDPLHRVACAFTSPTRSWTMGLPGYSSGAPAFIGSKTVRVPLAADYSHDVEAMIKMDPNAGAYYVCNPNNPTGTLTSRAKIEYLLANKPKDAVVILDEAYIHFSDNAKMGSDLVAAGKDVVVLRTFSKIYGMAGLRAGFAMARPDLLRKMQQFGAGGFMPVTATACATASLLVKNLIPERRAQMKAIREDVFAFLDKKSIKYIPSEANFFMLDTGTRKAADIGQLYMQNKVQLAGNRWPEWPNKIRVTVGSKDDMAKFMSATEKVYS